MKNIIVFAAVILVLGVVQCEAKCGGIIFEEKCFMLAYKTGSGKSLAEAKAWCQFYNGALAELDCEYNYNVISDYVLRNWMGYKSDDELFVNVWIGSTFDHATNSIVMTDGNAWKPRAGLYHTGFPNSNTSYVGVAFQVITGPGRSQKGFFNTPTSDEFQPVPLCVFPLTE